MKLLIVTQVIDTEHPILGFFHRWVDEFAKHCEHVHVIALQVGKHSLPTNVTVHSLGKDEGKGRFSYLVRFYSLIWNLRHEYDNVFVHMNQIYVILGAPFWRTLGKKIGLWYAHGTVSRSLKIAVFLANMVFTSTEQGMNIDTPKRKLVGQGIDTKIFSVNPQKKSENDVLQLITVGRISQSKNIETLLRACARLNEKNINFHFKVVGLAITDNDERYSVTLHDLCSDLGIDKYIDWVGAVPNHILPHLLQSSDVFIHDGSTNSLDKVLIEASLCGCDVVSSNPAYWAVTEQLAPKYLFTQGNHEDLAEIIKNLSTNRGSESVRNLFLNNFSVNKLISGIISEY